MSLNFCSVEDLRIPWSAMTTNKWIFDQIKPGFSLEAQMTRLRLSYFGHIVRDLNALETRTLPVKGEDN